MCSVLKPKEAETWHSPSGATSGNVEVVECLKIKHVSVAAS